MKNKISLFVFAGLMAANPTMADNVLVDPDRAHREAPVKVEGQVFVRTANRNHQSFGLGWHINKSTPDFRRFNVDQYRFEKDACAVEAAKKLQEWGKEGIKSKELKDAIIEYNAYAFASGVAEQISEVRLHAVFDHTLHGMEKDGSRRYPTTKSLGYGKLSLGVDATDENDYTIEVDSSMLDSVDGQIEQKLCHGKLKPEELEKLLAQKLKGGINAIQLKYKAKLEQLEKARLQKAAEQKRIQIRDTDLSDMVRDEPAASSAQ